ncbi:AmmeMemoRadiSam system protein A [Nitrosomonas sp.]|uniref:AmmeMemoRadiSam system protein A n=1 Tax=Nitrosomonas sp. TaxID=42353 RepID=UPI0025FBDF1C|nr:AmmeMemoRadiSam system protein A [Nitrosomonas sp.]MCC6917517.1 AmmeMemoRadiSam system protein A [Nitrosomonas sp.]
MIRSTDQDEQGKVLLKIARDAICRALHVPCDPVKTDAGMDWLQQPGATFVTLTRYGQLRGCIGSLEASNPLIENVRNNAVAAALRDPRFSPLSADELDSVHVEVSLLSRQQPVSFTSETDVLTQLRPGIDGVVLEYGQHRSTFLPQVWEMLPEPGQFLAKLKAKAYLPEDFWDEGIRLSRYTVSKWHEMDDTKGEGTNG